MLPVYNKHRNWAIRPRVLKHNRKVPGLNQAYDLSCMNSSSSLLLTVFVSKLGLRSKNAEKSPNSLDGLFVFLSVQKGRVHVKHPLIWGGGFLWIIQSSAAIQVATVHLHSVHGSVGVWARAGWLCMCTLNTQILEKTVEI